MKKIHGFLKKYKLYYLLLLPIAYAVFYLNTASAAMEEVEHYLLSTKTVEVTNGKVVSFLPKLETDKGIIFYPGGKVKPEAYAPMLYRLAEKGYAVYLCKMPFNLAVFDANAAAKVIENNPSIKSWVIGGHSLGGAMASQFVHDHPERISGIFFLAAYPIESTNLSEQEIYSLSLYGELDGLVNVNEIVNHVKLLPTDRNVQIIKGGNHAQFGYYGDQKGDNQAVISREEQQQAVLDELLKWLSAKH